MSDVLLCQDGSKLLLQDGDDLLLTSAASGSLSLSWTETAPGVFHFEGDLSL